MGLVLVVFVVFGASCSTDEGESSVGFGDGEGSQETSGDSSTSSEDLPDGDSSEDDEVSVDSTATTDDEPGDTQPSPSVDSTEPAETTTSTTIEQAPLSSECLGLDSPLLPAQITFTAENKLFAVGFDGQPGCLLPLDPGSEVVAWGSQADKVMFSDGRIKALNDDPEGRAADGVVREWAQFSRPTGFNTIWIAEGQLHKSRIDGAFDSVLELGVPVSGVRYHPDGSNLLVVIQDPTSAGDSVWVTTSEGEDGVPLLFAGDEATISDLDVTFDGSRVLFVATHLDGTSRLHDLDMAAATVEVSAAEGDELELFLEPSAEHGVETLHEAAMPLADLVVNGDSTYAALAEGSCETGRTVEVIDLVAGGYPLPVMANRSARPVGFTTPSELIVAVDGAECGALFDLYAVDLETGAERLLRAQVESAKIRRIDPPPSYSLTGVVITGFTS